MHADSVMIRSTYIILPAFGGLSNLMRGEMWWISIDLGNAFLINKDTPTIPHASATP